MMETGVSQYLYLLDEAFDGPDWHSLVRNLRSVRHEDWLRVLPGGRRSIREIVHHLGATIYIYHDCAFRDGTLTVETVYRSDAGSDPLATPEAAIPWLREGYDRLRRSLADLPDSELLRPRPAPWGEPKETRWIVSLMIQHTLYHAGEINHIRALLQQDDDWE